jgi:uncharacterized protein (UPF0548 family)
MRRRELERMGLIRTTAPGELAGVPFTYPGVGATRSARPPAGYGHTERRAVIGSGQRRDATRGGLMLHRMLTRTASLNSSRRPSRDP